MRQRKANVIRWPYRPSRNGRGVDVGMMHSGGSAVAWVRVVAEDGSVTSADPELIANARLLIEQRETA